MTLAPSPSPPLASPQDTRHSAGPAVRVEGAWDAPRGRPLGRMAPSEAPPMTARQPRPVPGRGPRAEGFTLLEVVIALGILATMLLILFQTYARVAEHATRARDLAQLSHEARVLLQLMANDVRSAYAKDAATQAQQIAQQAPQGGLLVTVPPPTFVGKDLTDEGQPADTLAFATIVPVQRPDVPETELCRVTYSLEPVINHPESLAWVSPAAQSLDPARPPSPSRGLFRRVNCHVDPTDTTQDQLVLLTEAARGLDFKYYNAQGTEYVDWDSQQPPGGTPLPAWIKITLLLVDAQRQGHPFTMLTELVWSPGSRSSTAGTVSTVSGTPGGAGSGPAGTSSPGSGTPGGLGSGPAGTRGTRTGPLGGAGSGPAGTGGTGSRR
jgi:type II secretory pathway pseudopilin PulG